MCMRARYLVVGLVVVLAVVTGFLIYQGNQTSTAGERHRDGHRRRRRVPPTADPVSPGDHAQHRGCAADAGRPADRPATNVPMTKLESGRQGTAVHHLLLRRRRLAPALERVHGRRRADQLALHRIPVRHLPARRSGQGRRRLHRARATRPARRPSGTAARSRRSSPRSTTSTWPTRKGHEIGTHYNGHFCERQPARRQPVDDRRLEQRARPVLRVHDRLEDSSTATPTPRTCRSRPSEVKGGRTPCLDG